MHEIKQSFLDILRKIINSVLPYRLPRIFPPKPTSSNALRREVPQNLETEMWQVKEWLHTNSLVVEPAAAIPKPSTGHHIKPVPHT
jgi:hypothetical protein